MEEVWKDIQEYEGLYQVSNLGRVRSLDRMVNNNGTKVFRKGIIMKTLINPSGYLTINLYKQNKSKLHFIHKIIANAFIENKENKKEVNHIDHDKLNNSIENLEWCTRKENINKMIDFYNKRKIINICIANDCDKETYDKNKKCAKCSNFDRRKTIRPEKEELLNLIINYTFSEISKQFNISESGIRKWCDDYELPRNKKQLDNYLRA